MAHEQDSYSEYLEELQGYLEIFSAEAVLHVRDYYGNGERSPAHFKPGSEGDLAYHNVQHTLRVREASVAVAHALGLSAYDQALVRFAASAHDIVHGHGAVRGDMERASALWATRSMDWATFPSEDIEAVRLAVLGTEPLFDENGAMVGQLATSLKYPTARAEAIGLSVACGDLASLYAPDGPRLGHDLYREYQGVGMLGVPALEGLLDFQHKQLHLLQTYRFPVEAGEQLFAGLREPVIAYHAQLTGTLANGEITEWSQVTAADDDFEQAYRTA